MTAVFEKGLIGLLFAGLAWLAMTVLGPIVGPAFQQAIYAAESASVSSTTSTTSIEIVTSDVYITAIDPIEGDFQEVNDNDGPEGPMPRPPGISEDIVLKIYVLERVGSKIAEIRNQLGQVVARFTLTQSDPTGFFDDWQNGLVWSGHIKVATEYGGNGLGLWLWKLGERLFYQPGVTRVMMDLSTTRSGQTGWTTHHIPGVLNHIQTNIAPYTVYMYDNVNRIWVIQYAP